VFEVMIVCPSCSKECDFHISQKILNRDTDIKIKFNIIEVECECGSKGLLSLKPRNITVINKTTKIVNF
tara:strand:+ start:1091 stop:1297 length:207 start_codon:yes stop_codon:yes gene_type:complete